MSIYDVAFAVIRALNELGVEYVVVGGIATMYYGFARTTLDVDFVVTLQSQRRLAEVAEKLGPGYRLDPQNTFEVYSGKPYRTIHVLNTQFEIDFFFSTDDPFDREQFARKQKVRLLDHDVFMTTAEDVIVMKLRWQRKKDLVDAAFVIGTQGAGLDWPYIERWCDVHAVRDVLEGVRRDIPPMS